MGMIGLVEECAGAGRVLQVRVSDNYGTPPVDVVAGQAFHLEVDYLPVAAHDPIQMTVTAVTARGTFPLVRGDVGRIPQPGVACMAIHPIIVHPSFAGQDLVLRVELGSNGVTEACINLPARIVAPHSDRYPGRGTARPGAAQTRRGSRSRLRPGERRRCDQAAQPPMAMSARAPAVAAVTAPGNYRSLAAALPECTNSAFPGPRLHQGAVLPGPGSGTADGATTWVGGGPRARVALGCRRIR